MCTYRYVLYIFLHSFSFKYIFSFSVSFASGIFTIFLSCFLYWQIAASYGSIVCIFEPVQQPDQKDTLSVSSIHFFFVLSSHDCTQIIHKTKYYQSGFGYLECKEMLPSKSAQRNLLVHNCACLKSVHYHNIRYRERDNLRLFKKKNFLLMLNVVFILSVQKLNCQWQKTGQFVLESMVRNLAWHPTGTLSTFLF